MLTDTTHDDQRVLLLAPTRRDAQAIGELLAQAHIKCFSQPNVSALCQAMSDGVGAVIVSEEALATDGSALASCVATQPVWSDLPIIVLSRAGAESQTITKFFGMLGNIAVMERPVRLSTFQSVVASALRARERQYQVREHLAESEKSAAERIQLLDSERAARSEAERASKMKDEFLATLSHELRNPLNAILGWSQILRMGDPSPDEVEEGIQVIERNAQAQTQIIEDLLDMSRIISGKVHLDVRRIDLSEVVRSAIETVKPAADAKRIRLQISLNPSGGPIAGDPNRLQQVFWNLLSNAVKFTPNEGAIEILLENVTSHIEVSVVDSGEGIEPSFLPYVFDRFRQADGSTTRRHGGLGLGLALVRQLVELHGGTVRAKSDGSGTGATFIVSLPISVMHAEPIDHINRRHSAAAKIDALNDIPSLAGVKILVVDDEPDARLLLLRLLQDRSADVRVAASASEAIEILEEMRPHVLVSDIGMPTEDGYCLIRKVRALAPQRGGETKAIALTAYARTEDRVNVMMAGFQHHLAKPVQPAELVAVVASLVGKSTVK
jgi:signal transduction histidine kinase/ActR/RegA family two-component response regulator